jgi:hypothetical protein
MTQNQLVFFSNATCFFWQWLTCFDEFVCIAHIDDVDLERPFVAAVLDSVVYRVDGSVDEFLDLDACVSIIDDSCRI